MKWSKRTPDIYFPSSPNYNKESYLAAYIAKYEKFYFILSFDFLFDHSGKDDAKTRMVSMTNMDIFENYKKMESEKWVKIHGFRDADLAIQTIKDSKLNL